ESDEKCLNKPFKDIGRIFTFRLQIKHLKNLGVGDHDDSLPLNPGPSSSCDCTTRSWFSGTENAKCAKSNIVQVLLDRLNLLLADFLGVVLEFSDNESRRK